MHTESLIKMKYFRDKYTTKADSILDVGSAIVNNWVMESYKDVFIDYNYTGMDAVKGKNVDIVGYDNITHTYDIVISGQTLEHVENPFEFMKNLTKYFTKYICIIAPNAGREHRHPIDTFRYFPDGMRALFKYAGIKEIEIFRDKVDTVGIGGLWI